MKSIKYLSFLFLTVVMVSSCKVDDYLIYNYGEYVFFKSNDASPKSKTFANDPSTVTSDIVFFATESMGKVKNYDRKIKLEQIMIEEDGVVNAIPGVHYVPFDSKEMEEILIMPKDTVATQLPIVVLRHESLIDGVVTLKFRIVESSDFRPGIKAQLERQLTISGKLIQPTKWDTKVTDEDLGKWSVTKHQWMIDETGEKWDDAFFALKTTDPEAYGFWLDELTMRLNKKNFELEAAGKDRFKDEFNEYIVFPQR